MRFLFANKYPKIPWKIGIGKIRPKIDGTFQSKASKSQKGFPSIHIKRNAFKYKKKFKQLSKSRSHSIFAHDLPTRLSTKWSLQQCTLFQNLQFSQTFSIIRPFPHEFCSQFKKPEMFYKLGSNQSIYKPRKILDITVCTTGSTKTMQFHIWASENPKLSSLTIINHWWNPSFGLTENRLSIFVNRISRDPFSKLYSILVLDPLEWKS